MTQKNTQLQGDRCRRCNGKGSVVADVGGFSAEVDCPECKGTGITNSQNACTECKGSGKTIVDYGGINFQVGCPHCNGTGLEPLPA